MKGLCVCENCFKLQKSWLYFSASFHPGFPQPEYRWMKDGAFLTDYSPEHFYKIQNVTKSDAGNYQCYARNDVGVIVSENISLVVACKYLNSNNQFLYIFGGNFRNVVKFGVFSVSKTGFRFWRELWNAIVFKENRFVFWREA